MTRGAPDYLVITGGKTIESYTAYSQVQPPIAMFDDFESTTLKWEAESGTVARDTTPVYVWNGDAAMKITTDPVELLGSVYRYLCIPEVITSMGIIHRQYCSNLFYISQDPVIFTITEFH